MYFDSSDWGSTDSASLLGLYISYSLRFPSISEIASRAAHKIRIFVLCQTSFTLVHLLMPLARTLHSRAAKGFVNLYFSCWLGSTKDHPTDRRPYPNIYFTGINPLSGSCFATPVLPMLTGSRSSELAWEGLLFVTVSGPSHTRTASDSYQVPITEYHTSIFQFSPPPGCGTPSQPLTILFPSQGKTNKLDVMRMYPRFPL